MTQTVIIPTVGRQVLYHSGPETAPLAAIVCCVHNDRCVNLAIFDPNGVPYSSPPTSITLVQPEELCPPTGHYCCWMDYQVDQANDSDSLKDSPGESGDPVANEDSTSGEKSDGSGTEKADSPGGQHASPLTA